MGFFENLFTSFEVIVNSVVIQTDYFDIFRYSIVGYFTFRLMWMGYMTQFERIQTPITESIYIGLKYAVIIIFASNYNGYLDLVFKAINGFKDYVSGNTNIFAMLDHTVKTGGNLASLLYEEGNMESGSLASLIVWVFIFFACSAPIFIIMVNIVKLKLLTLTAPLFIGCLMFGWFKNLFTQWLSLVVSSVLTYLFLGLILQISVNFLEKQILLITENAENEIPNTFDVAGTAVLICIATYILAKISVEIAKAIGQVSIERASMDQTAKASNLITKGASRAGKSVANATPVIAKNVSRGATKARGAFNRAMNKYTANN